MNVELTTARIVQLSIAGFLVFAAWPVGAFVQRRVRPLIEKRKTQAAGGLFSTLAKASVIFAMLLVAATLAFPSIDVAAIIGGFGLLGVAAGFAFQDILSNLLSGVLIILRETFHVGDQIRVGDVHGTVEDITIRETRIRTFDGRTEIIPNKDVYTSVVELQTDGRPVRTSVIVGVDYETDLPQAREQALAALATVDGVHADPAPQALWTDFGASSINLDLRYWTEAEQVEIRKTQSAVVEAIKAAFDKAGIGIPFDIVTLESSSSFEEALRQRAPQEHLADLSVDDLRTIASAMEVDGRSAMTKDELVEEVANSLA